MTELAVALRDVFRVHRTGQGDAAALQGLELDVLEGEVLCVLGPSGAGKSSLLRTIAGIETPSAGTVRIFGTDIGREPERARARFRHRHLGFISQSAERAAPSALLVSEAVELPLALRGRGRAARRRRASELIEAVGLSGRERARLPDLSGGERQRVTLCAAIAHDPSLLLADEPTGELDGESARVIGQLITELARARGMTVVIASHDETMARSADRTVTIAGGRIAEERRDGGSVLMLNRGGWLRIPPRQRQQAGIGRTTHIRDTGGELVLATADAPAPVPVDPGGPPVCVAHESESASKPARVEVRSVTRAFGRGSQRRTVLAELSYSFPPSSLTVIAGRSGSGKTTLLRLLAGLDQPDAGQVLIDADTLAGQAREQLAALRRHRIGYMSQEPVTVAFLSARENVSLALELRATDPAVAAPKATAWLRAVGLDELEEQRVHRLSAGEVQRVALARAMAAARGLLIIDEPTSRLDEASTELVAGLLREASRGGQTVICATHDPRLIELADETLNLSS